MPANFSSRIKKLQKVMFEQKVSRLLITDTNDVYYYTGHKVLGDDSVFLVIGKGRPELFVSPLSNEAETLKGIDVFTIRKIDDVKSALNGSIGYDEHNLSSYLFLKLRKSGIKLKPEADTIKKPREIKDSWEIEQIKKAIKITKGVIENIDIKSAVEKSESQVARKIDSEFIKSGASNSFETIISSGRNGYFIHHVPGKRRIKREDLVIIDLGAKLEYCSDITRTFCLKPGKREREILEYVAVIQKEIMEKIRDGVEFKDIQGFYEKIMKSRKYKVFHGFGHGIGLSAHEAIKGKLKEGMVLTVEPGVYIKNLGGCRIEDMVLVKKRGIKVLSESIRF